MTREEYKNQILLLQKDFEEVLLSDLTDVPLPKVVMILNYCYYIIAGIGDAILEIRDNTRPSPTVGHNPFGHDYQNRVNKP